LPRISIQTTVTTSSERTLGDLVTVDTRNVTSHDKVSQNTSQDGNEGNDQQGSNDGSDDDTGDFTVSQTSVCTRNEATALVFVGLVFLTEDFLAKVVGDTACADTIVAGREEEQVFGTAINEALTVASTSTSVGEQRSFEQGVDGGAISVGDVATA